MSRSENSANADNNTRELEMDETAWLIEIFWLGSPTYYGTTEEGVLGMTADHNKAVRFSRAQDAQAVIDDIGWTEAKPSEHMWCS